jgi:hypothetical protein
VAAQGQLYVLKERNEENREDVRASALTMIAAIEANIRVGKRRIVQGPVSSP